MISYVDIIFVNSGVTMVARTLTNRDKMMKIYGCVTVSEQHSFNGFLIAERRSNDNTQNRFKLNLRNKKLIISAFQKYMSTAITVTYSCVFNCRSLDNGKHKSEIKLKVSAKRMDIMYIKDEFAFLLANTCCATKPFPTIPIGHITGMMYISCMFNTC
jgi:ribosomal protein L28